MEALYNIWFYSTFYSILCSLFTSVTVNYYYLNKDMVYTLHLGFILGFNVSIILT